MIKYYLLGLTKDDNKVVFSKEINEEMAKFCYKNAGISAASSLDSHYPIDSNWIGHLVPMYIRVEKLNWRLDPLNEADIKELNDK